MKVNILIVKGVEGPSCYINDYRVAGNKPWGGGREVFEFGVDEKDILEALNHHPNKALNADTREPCATCEEWKEVFGRRFCSICGRDLRAG